MMDFVGWTKHVGVDSFLTLSSRIGRSGIRAATARPSGASVLVEARRDRRHRRLRPRDLLSFNRACCLLTVTNVGERVALGAAGRQTSVLAANAGGGTGR